MRSSRRQERRSESMGVGWGSQSSLSPALLLCFLLDLTYGTYKERSPRCSIFPWALNALTSIYLVQRRNVPLPRTLLWYKLAINRFYWLSSPHRIFRLRESSCGLQTMTLRAILPHLLPAILALYYRKPWGARFPTPTNRASPSENHHRTL